MNKIKLFGQKIQIIFKGLTSKKRNSSPKVKKTPEVDGINKIRETCDHMDFPSFTITIFWREPFDSNHLLYFHTLSVITVMELVASLSSSSPLFLLFKYQYSILISLCLFCQETIISFLTFFFNVFTISSMVGYGN